MEKYIIKEKIKEVIKILSQNQRDIKYILKKYNHKGLWVFDEMKTYNKEVITALLFLQKNIYKDKDDLTANKFYRNIHHYIFDDIIYDYKKQDIVETFFANLTKYYWFFIHLDERSIRSRYSNRDDKYTDLKEMAFVIDKLLMKYPLPRKTDSWLSYTDIDTDEDENILRKHYQRKYKMKKFIDETT